VSSMTPGKKGDANPRVIKALIEANALFARGRLKHTYPHSWRSGKPGHLPQHATVVCLHGQSAGPFEAFYAFGFESTSG